MSFMNQHCDDVCPFMCLRVVQSVRLWGLDSLSVTMVVRRLTRLVSHVLSGCELTRYGFLMGLSARGSQAALGT